MADQHVVPRGTEWAVVAAGSGKASATFTTKQQAINMAKAIAKGLQAKLVIHGTSGRVIDMVSYAQARTMAAKQIPILYSGHMALAKVQLRKDVTRRLAKAGDLEIWQSLDHYKQSKKLRWNVGDILWGKENYRLNTHGETFFVYEADGAESGNLEDLLLPAKELEKWQNRAALRPDLLKPSKLYPSIFMPKFACRIWDEIVDVRIERLHDITNEDAIREGLEQVGVMWRDYSRPVDKLEKGCFVPCMLDAVESYRSLWESINGVGSWDDNSWVWRIETRTIQRPEAAVHETAAQLF